MLCRQVDCGSWIFILVIATATRTIPQRIVKTVTLHFLLCREACKNAPMRHVASQRICDWLEVVSTTPLQFSYFPSAVYHFFSPSHINTNTTKAEAVKFRNSFVSTQRRHFSFMPLDLQIFRFILWINFVVACQLWNSIGFGSRHRWRVRFPFLFFVSGFLDLARERTLNGFTLYLQTGYPNLIDSSLFCLA